MVFEREDSTVDAALIDRRVRGAVEEATAEGRGTDGMTEVGRVARERPKHGLEAMEGRKTGVELPVEGSTEGKGKGVEGSTLRPRLGAQE